MAREKGEPMVPQEWVGKRVEVDLVRPGPTLMGATYQGTLNAVTDLDVCCQVHAQRSFILPCGRPSRRLT